MQRYTLPGLAVIAMIETLFLPLALAFIMFSLGLALRPGDFRVALYGWRGIAMGLCGQVLLLPLLAFLISVALDLSPTAQLGLMLIAACPGGVSSAFLTHLAVEGNVAASTQNQARSALLFLYKEVLGSELPWLNNVEQAKKPRRLPRNLCTTWRG